MAKRPEKSSLYRRKTTSRNVKRDRTGGVERVKIGRPTIFSKEIADEICELIACATPLATICERADMPSQRSIYRWLNQNEDFRRDYARAREHRADARADRIDEIMLKLEHGKIEPQAARVLFDAERWQAGREQPKRYGDKVAIGGSADEPLRLQVEAEKVSDLDLARWMINTMTAAEKALKANDDEGGQK